MDEVKTKAKPEATCQIKVTRVDGTVEYYESIAQVEYTLKGAVEEYTQEGTKHG